MYIIDHIIYMDYDGYHVHSRTVYCDHPCMREYDRLSKQCPILYDITCECVTRVSDGCDPHIRVCGCVTLIWTIHQ